MLAISDSCRSKNFVIALKVVVYDSDKCRVAKFSLFLRNTTHLSFYGLER